MGSKQKTIKYSVSCTGVGLHTGVQSTVTFHPADENTGIKFIRNDKGDKVVTPDIDNVVDLTRGTTIEENGVRVHTTEHVMSACAGMRINNLLIELNSKEPPVMDGSSKDFVSSLIEGQIVDQNAPVNFLEITKKKFNDYQIFIDRNPDYPRIGRLRYLAEKKIYLKNTTPNNVINWLNKCHWHL